MTDVDVSGDGARAVAVVRDTAEVAILPLANARRGVGVTHLTITGETIRPGVADGGREAAVLYSNAVAAEARC